MNIKRKFKCALVLGALIAVGCGGGGGGGGGPKSCATSDECEVGEYCNFADFSCGAAGATGACAPIGTACTMDSAPVCSCDRLTFVNACWAAADSQSLRAASECP